MKIRKFRKKDAEQCSKMIVNIINESKNLTKQAKENIKSGSKQGVLIKKSKSRDYFVCEKNGKIIAIGGLKKNEIIRMYISLKQQNKGIGSLILEYLEKLAKKRKIKKVFLYTHPRASKFYLKNGWKIIKQYRDRGMDVVNMEKELK